MNLVEILEVRCPVHGVLYGEMDREGESPIIVDASRLRAGAVGRCSPCWFTIPTPPLLYSTEPVAR